MLRDNSLLKTKKYQIGNEDDMLENQNKILKELIEIKQQLRGHEEQIEHVEQQNDTILTTFKQIVRKNFNIDEKLQFPIKCEEKLGQIDSIISQNKEKYVNIIQNIITPAGLYSNFDKLISTDLILLMNYDGVNGKHSFKQYQALNHAIFDAMKTDGFTEKEYVKNIRLCFKNYKNRHFRKVSFEKKNQKTQVL